MPRPRIGKRLRNAFWLNGLAVYKCVNAVCADRFGGKMDVCADTRLGGCLDDCVEVWSDAVKCSQGESEGLIMILLPPAHVALIPFLLTLALADTSDLTFTLYSARSTNPSTCRLFGAIMDQRPIFSLSGHSGGKAASTETQIVAPLSRYFGSLMHRLQQPCHNHVKNGKHWAYRQA